MTNGCESNGLHETDRAFLRTNAADECRTRPLSDSFFRSFFDYYDDDMKVFLSLLSSKYRPNILIHKYINFIAEILINFIPFSIKQYTLEIYLFNQNISVFYNYIKSDISLSNEFK